MIVDHRDVRRALVGLAVPIAASLVGDQLLGVVDTIVIGTLGAAALAAVTGATTVLIVLALTLSGITHGAGILGAQAIGGGDAPRFGRIVRAGAIAPLCASMLIAFAALHLAEPTVRALVGPLPTVAAGGTYLLLRCFSLIPMAISMITYTAFGAAGDTAFGFRLLVIINAIHIPLLLVLALGLGTHHPLGIEGAGISSLVSEIVGACYALGTAWRRPQYHIFSGIDISRPLVWRTTMLGLPEAAYLFLVLAPDIAIVSLLSSLGDRAIAAFRVLIIVSDLTWAIPGSLSGAAQTILGQRFGAGDVAGARAFDRQALGYSLRLSTLTGLGVALCAWPIAAAVTLAPALASLAALPLALHMATLPLKGYALMGIARIRAAGDTRFSMIVGAIASGFVIPAAYVGIAVLHLGLFAVPLAWIGAWTFWSLATALRLRRFDWHDARLA
jgi:putative MATE family efflux protein